MRKVFRPQPIRAWSATLSLLFLAAGLAGGLGANSTGGGQPTPAVFDEAAGKALAARLCAVAPTEASDRHGVLVITSGGNTREIPVDCKVEWQGTAWRTIYESSNTPFAPAEKLIIVHSAAGPNQYLFASAPSPGAPLPDPQAISGDALEQPFAGSDFSIGDLGLDFFHWPGQKERIPGEMRLGQSCFVLESANDRKTGIVRIKSSIDKDTLGLLEAEAYDSAGNKIKEFSLDSASFKKDAQGHGELKEIRIYNLKSHSHTDLKFDTIKY